MQDRCVHEHERPGQCASAKGHGHVIGEGADDASDCGFGNPAPRRRPGKHDQLGVWGATERKPYVRAGA